MTKKNIRKKGTSRVTIREMVMAIGPVPAQGGNGGGGRREGGGVRCINRWITGWEEVGGIYRARRRGCHHQCPSRNNKTATRTSSHR